MPKKKIMKITDVDGSTKFLFWHEDGYWIDDDGCKYPDFFDEGYPGLEPFTTGAWDPFWKDEAKNHDKAFAAKKTGYEGKTNGEVAGDFIKGVSIKMVKGAYAVVAGPLYILIGGIGGMFRWMTLGNKDKE